MLGLSADEWAIVTALAAANLLFLDDRPPRRHVPVSLVVSAAVSAVAAGMGAGPRDQGLAPARLGSGAVYGIAASAPIVAAIAAGVAMKGLRPLYAGPPGRPAAAYGPEEVLIRIPFGTAFPEELMFRGALLAMLRRRHGPLAAAAASSLLFGLWHIAPTLKANFEGRFCSRKLWLTVAMSVAATTVAGLPLAWLRYRSGSIVAPWIVHSAANMTGVVTSSRAARGAAEGWRRPSAARAP